jgi:hypothetical protein
MKSNNDAAIATIMKHVLVRMKLITQLNNIYINILYNHPCRTDFVACDDETVSCYRLIDRRTRPSMNLLLFN